MTRSPDCQAIHDSADPSERQHDRVRRRYRGYADHYDRSYRRYTAHTNRHVLRALSGIASPRSILDACCGTGGVTAALASRFRESEIVGVDLSPEMLGRAREHLRSEAGRVRFAEAPAESLPLASGSVDLVVCANALHLVPEPAQALAEFARVTSPGGLVVILDWTLDALAMRLLAAWLNATQGARRRLLDRRALGRALASAGWTVESVEPVRIPPAWGLMLARARKPST